MDSVWIEIQDSAVDLMSVVSFKKHNYDIRGEDRFTLSLNMINRVGEDIMFSNKKDRDEAFTQLLKLLQGL